MNDSQDIASFQSEQPVPVVHRADRSFEVLGGIAARAEIVQDVELTVLVGELVELVLLREAELETLRDALLRRRLA